MVGMGMKFAKLPVIILIIINVISVVGLLVTGYSYILSPIDWPYLSLMGYFFPAFLFSNGLFLALWVFVNWRYLFIPVIGFIAAYQPLSLYCPFFTSSSVDEAEYSSQTKLTILSYNTYDWGKYDKAVEDGKVSVIEYIANQKPDIVCLQESALDSKALELVKDYMPEMKYHTSIRNDDDKNGVVLAFLSKYHINKEKNLEIPSKSNAAGAIWVDVNRKQLLVVNCHLETQSMSEGEKERFSRLVHDVANGDMEKDSMKSGSKFYLKKLSASAQKRAPQAELVSEFIKENSNISTIVCGDFNDIPLSYTHYVISDGLTDCYQKRGRGFGFSYCHNAMRVRIDHILCSPDINPIKCWVDSDIKLSDHYPIISHCLLENKEKK